MGQAASGPQGIPGMSITGEQGKQGNSITGPRGEKGISVTGEQGLPGKQGVGIKSATTDATGILTMTMTDDTVNKVQLPLGPKGVDIKEISGDAAGLLSITMSDGKVYKVQTPKGIKGDSITGPRGEQGIQGVPGVPGVSNIPGIGIKSATIDTAGILSIIMSDDSVNKVQVPIGPQGISIKDITIDPLGILSITKSDGTVSRVQVPKGPIGLTGAVGSKGDSITGPQGITGAVGSKGDIGPAGPAPDYGKLMYSADGTIMKSPIGINMTKKYSALSTPTDSEISNDTADYKSLMILGNTSSGNGKQVRIYDDLTVDRNIKSSIGGVSTGNTALISKNGISIPTGDSITIRDQYHGMTFDPVSDGPMIYGHGGGSLVYNNGGAPVRAVSWNSERVNVNNVKITNGYKGGDNSRSSEISNDIGDYKALMLIGNNSIGGNVRKVQVWDDLAVNGTVSTDKLCNKSGSRCINVEDLLSLDKNYRIQSVYGRMMNDTNGDSRFGAIGDGDFEAFKFKPSASTNSFA